LFREAAPVVSVRLHRVDDWDHEADRWGRCETYASDLASGRFNVDRQVTPWGDVLVLEFVEVLYRGGQPELPLRTPDLRQLRFALGPVGVAHRNGAKCPLPHSCGGRPSGEDFSRSASFESRSSKGEWCTADLLDSTGCHESPDGRGTKS